MPRFPRGNVALEFCGPSEKIYRGGVRSTNRTRPNQSGEWNDRSSAGRGDHVLSPRRTTPVSCRWSLGTPSRRLRFRRHSSPSCGGVWAASFAKFRNGTAISRIQWSSSAAGSFLAWPCHVARYPTPSGSQKGGPLHQSVRARLSTKSTLTEGLVLLHRQLQLRIVTSRILHL